MWELRFVSVHDDGEHLVVRSPDLDDEEFLLAVTDELRDALAAPSRPHRPEPAPDQPLTPREIQSRIRAGEAPEELARASGVPVSKIERFAGPVLAERAHIVEAARAARITWSAADGDPGSLADVVDGRLEEAGVAPDTVEWDAWRRDDGVWMVQVAYRADDARTTAEWSWDPARRQLRPYGAAARALSAAPASTHPTDSPDARTAPIGLRMVPGRPAAPGPLAAVQGTSGWAPDTVDIREPTATGASTGDEDGDGVAQRAAVPSWDDILFGVKRER
jgi:hypothetical protein